MKKIGLVAGAAAALVALAYPATAWYLGKRVQAAVDESYQMLADYPYVRVVKRDYDRGVFSATEVVTFELFGPQVTAAAGAQSLQEGAGASDMPAPMQLTFRSQISHGPLPGWRALGAASAESELVLEGELAARLATLMGGEKPLAIRTVYDFSGGGVATLRSPAFEGEFASGDGAMQRVAWGGLTMSMTFDAGMARYTLDASAPRLELSGGVDDVRVALNGLRLEGDQTRMFAEEPLLYAGKMRFSLDEMRFGGGAAAGSPVVLKQAVYEADVPVDGEFMNIVGKLGAQTVQFGAQNFGPVHYDISLNHLHARTVAKLHREWLKLSADPAAIAAASSEGGAGAAFAPLMAPAMELLRHQPELRLDRLSMGGPHGEARIAGRAALREAPPEAFANPLMLIGYLDASADMSVPEALVASFAPGSDDGADPEAAAARTAMLQQQLDGLAAQGLIRREGGVVKSAVAFTNGQLAVNGRPIGPLPMGGAPN